MDELTSFIANVEQAIRDNTDTLDSECASAVQCVWRNIGCAKDVLHGCFAAKSKPPECFDSLLMLNNVLIDVINAFLGIRQGYWRGPLTILRAAWEDLACAVAIRDNPQIYEKFKKGKYSPTDAVTYVTKMFPEVGRQYGTLSNGATHAKYFGLGRGVVRDDKGHMLSVVPVYGLHGMPLVDLLNCAFAARYTGAMAELCTARLIHNLYYWHRSENDQLAENLLTEEDLLIKALMVEAHAEVSKREQQIAINDK